MKSLKFAALGLAMAFAATGCASTMYGSNMASHPMSATDSRLMSSCMAMSQTDRMGNSECMGLMRRMNMSNADMTTMASCHAMSHEDMMRNQDCARLMRMHFAIRSGLTAQPWKPWRKIQT